MQERKQEEKRQKLNLNANVSLIIHKAVIIYKKVSDNDVK